MTAEQEALVNNVDRLVKENDSLNRRVRELEARASSPEAKKDVEAARVSAAEANMGLESLRQEMSHLRGSAEEAEHEKAKLRDSLRSLQASLTTINERVSALENSGKTSDKSVSELRSAVDANEKKLTELKEAVKAAAAAAAEPQQKKEASDPEDLYSKGYRETQDKDFRTAADTFRTFLETHPNHKYAANAQYWLGEVYYAQGEWEKAILEFDKVRKKYPKGEKVAASILKQGFSFEKLGSKKEARVLLEEVVERFPGTSEASLAKKKLEALK